MKKKFVLGLVILLFSACSTGKPTTVGDDRTVEGCIPSAGYVWCERTGQCERPWELAKEHDFENSQEAFERFCGSDGK